VNRINERSSCCEMRLQKIEDTQVEHASLYHQLSLLIRRHEESIATCQESLAKSEDTFTKWCAQLEKDSKHMFENVGNALAAIREGFNVLKSDHEGHVEQQKNQFNELKSKLQSERVGWQKLLEAETSSRIRELKEFERRLDKQVMSQDEFTSSHQHLLAAHKDLSVAHAETIKVFSDRYSQLEGRLVAECQIANAAQERNAVEVTISRGILEQLGEVTAADRHANEMRWKEAESLRQEMQRKIEVRLHALVNSFMSALI